ncbi:hypothetical protein TBLA_0A06470 [Henningerozyma blattae CBS 6284]|uniref:Ubiquitin carboxyl-terminal hydrolase 2 n=1 Tax=Henningerozyma blattae (strain ATCC 34711 / CBS 6284 / DSM 70876 / NBRC 10599 / NRRL Y-10934 / UCD 77-7) TaxID=1071380 RepID=I2GWD7_HENB6|nr:hypothetical protein TBLA_0A06470 [Tetrapisispora blattae CBS 6284]CCH58439.1 hypothetical protein TBLA_0A06470 [Tetrapisispora blattae CBS 6284]
MDPAISTHQTSDIGVPSDLESTTNIDIQLSDNSTEQTSTSSMYNEELANQLSQDSNIIPEVDDGKHILYDSFSNHSFFKTADRLLDDLMIDLSYMLFNNSSEHINDNNNNNDNNHNNNNNTSNSNNDTNEIKTYINGILRLPSHQYSKDRYSKFTFAMGTIVDQINLQTRFEFKSVTCPEFNDVHVLLGVLMDNRSQAPLGTFLPVYHFKITVKTRSYLEKTKKHVGISHFHLIDFDDLHEFDKKDLEITNHDINKKSLLDSAIFISEDTNKLVMLEIFKPEFNELEEIESFSQESIAERYINACSRFPNLDQQKIPTQLECLNTVFKIFKGPLNHKNINEPLKAINADNPLLNSHWNPNWLLTKYGFIETLDNNPDTQEEFKEYLPPNLADYINDINTRALRESYIRKCLELIFISKRNISLMGPNDLQYNSKAIRSFNILQTVFTTSFWHQFLYEHKPQLDTYNKLDYEYHYINLLTSFYYTERDIIRNYNCLTALDPVNIGIYYDALAYIAQSKNSYQLISFVSKQDVIGQEALNQALTLFNIDNNDSSAISTLTESMIFTIYKTERKQANISSARLAEMKNALRLLAKYKHSDRLKFYADYEPYFSASQGYNTLEVDESVDDDIIQTAYTIKVNDAPGLKIDCDRALLTVATRRKSLALFKFLLQECPQFTEFYGVDRFDYFQALNTLQVNENATDETILEIFQQRWSNDKSLDYDSMLNLQSALSKIAYEKNSKLISNFIDTGIVDPTCLPVENWPAGLNNIGNTCYLNSLLQYYFSIKPLRDFILQYQMTMKHFQNEIVLNKQLEKRRRIGGREVNELEVERSVQFIYQVRDLFKEMIFSQMRCVSPRQELAYLAFMPSNIEVEFESASTEDDMGDKSNAQDAVVLQDEAKNDTDINLTEVNLIDLEPATKVSTSNDQPTMDAIEILTNSDNKSKELSKTNPFREVSPNEDITISTRVAKISSDQLENAFEMGRQQDVTECIGNVLFQLETGFDPISLDNEDNEQYDLVKELFYGKTKQSIIPLNHNSNERIKVERFLSLLVNITDHPKDIYDALNQYFADEFLTMEEYGDVKKTLSMTEYPKILQIQIQRVYYDRERFMPFKSIEPLPFEQVIYMDRYAESSDPELISKKEETAQLKLKLKEYRARQKELLSKNELGLSRKEAMMETIKFLKSPVILENGIDTTNKDVLVRELQQYVDGINNELSNLYNKINQLQNRIDHQFDDFKKLAYSLFAVFIHRGEASYGHYWVYIKDHSKNGIWRKYNDESVTEVPEQEVFNFTEGNTATPYFLVYVKQDSLSDIEPLKRIIQNTEN